MEDPNWASYKKASPSYMSSYWSYLQKMIAEQDEEEEDAGPKTPKQRRVAKTPQAPEKKGKTKEERVAWFKSAHEEHMERFRQPGLALRARAEPPRFRLPLRKASRSKRKCR